jgi:hypothetical protein
MMDEHCAWRSNGALNELFGITSADSTKRTLVSGANLEVTGEGSQWGIKAADIVGVASAENGVHATATSHALARAADADAVIARQTGKGQTFYLNALFDRYPKLRGEKSGGAGYRALLGALLERAGVRPPAEVLSPDGHRLTHAQVARYRFGDSEVLTVVTDNVALEGATGRDGVTVYNDAGLGQVARQEITIRLPRKVHVTDVRTGKRLGFTDTVRTSVVVGDALVLGLSASETTIKLSGPATAARGEHVRFTIDSEPSGRRLVRCHFFAPGGSLLDAYAKNVLVEGARAAVVLPSALSDPAGEYTLRVTDVVSGATAEVKVRLK